ncbi:hypothetical protein GCM10009430_38060 [Aquimarina litoralis]|uniref:Lipoprotein n=1 Tax=Aquimarina litoralis TaxID=584605 RepID=A0ABP3UEN9_9FLAO
MKKIIFLLVISIGIISCEKEETLIESVVSKDILTFPSKESFFETDVMLSQLSDKELLEWSRENNSNSLLIYENDFNIKEKEDVFRSIKAILNKDLMFKIGQKRIVLINDVFYELPDDYYMKSVNQLKGNVDNFKSIGETKNVVSPNNSEDSSLVLEDNSKANCYVTSLTHNEVHRRGYQKEFTRRNYRDFCGQGAVQPGNPRMKYFHELVSRYVKLYATEQHTLYIVSNILYYNGRKWRDAGEDHNVTVKVTDWSFLKPYHQYANCPRRTPVFINKTDSCKNGQVWTLIRLQESFIPANLNWGIKVEGTVTHSVNTDISSNTWVNSVSW